MTMQQFRNVVIGFIVSLMLGATIMAYILHTKSKKISEQANLINAISDTLKTVRLSDSSQRATIQVIQTASTKDFLEIQAKDSEILRLQALVSEYKDQLKPGGSATVITGQTNINGNGITTVVSKDSIRKDSFIYVYPQYKSTLGDRWYTANMIMSKDSSHLQLQVINDYDVVIGNWKGVWSAEVTNHNPYSTTTTMRTYSVTMPTVPPKRIGIGLQVGYGVILEDKPKLQPYIGVGISYNLIRF